MVDLREPEVVQEEVDPAVFGNLLHRVMELVYQSVVSDQNRKITAEVVKELKKNQLAKSVALAFREHFGGKDETGFVLEGRNLIVHDIVLKMAQQIMAMDEAYAPFDIISLERDEGRGYFWETTIEDDKGEASTVSLRGIIDRIDRKGDAIRVLDYKTGRDEKQAKDLPSLFDRDEKQRNKAAFQALFYALLYHQHSRESGIVPGLINAKDLFNQEFDARIFVGKEVVNDFTNWEEPFIGELHTLLLELFDPTSSFDQTDDLRKCSMCPYAKLCY